MEVRKQQQRLYFSRAVLLERGDLADRQDNARSLLRNFVSSDQQIITEVTISTKVSYLDWGLLFA
jgi:hypothetical protein